MRKTSYEVLIGDWSSDVCSSDLKPAEDAEEAGKDADPGTDEAPAPVRPPLKPPERPNLQSLRMDCQHAPSQANATTPLRPCNGRVDALVRIGVPARRAAAGLHGETRLARDRQDRKSTRLNSSH